MFKALKWWWTDGRHYRRLINHHRAQAASHCPPWGSLNIMRAYDHRAEAMEQMMWVRAPFSVAEAQDRLKDWLLKIRHHDTDYEVRYPLVLEALSLAYQAGYTAGIRIDPAQPEWPVAYIEIPTGQVSWHMPQHPLKWDGHTTEEKFKRIRAFAGLG